MSKSKDIGNAGERNHRSILRAVWPEIDRYDDRYHPTRDHKNTGRYHVESKKRATWNIKDVVRDMEQKVPIEVGLRWFIAYEDRNRTLKDNPSGTYAIIPLPELARLLQAAGEGDTKPLQYIP